MQGAYEKDVKNLILHNKHVFAKGSVNQVAVFEKRITKKTRADCLIFSKENGLVGIEIKTDRDSTKRLFHQLRDYLEVCNYVYVLIHENMLEEVTKTIIELSDENIMANRVGIVVYKEFKDRLILGTLIPAKAQQVNYKKLVNIVWSSECREMAQKVAKDYGMILRVTSKAGMINFIQHHEDFMSLIIDMYVRRNFDMDHKITTYKVVDNYGNDRQTKKEPI